MFNCVITEKCMRIMQNAWTLVDLQGVSFDNKCILFSSIFVQFMKLVVKNISISLISFILDLKIPKEFKQKMDEPNKFS